MGDKIKAFRQSKVGQFVTKFSDDQGMNLAVLLAWGTLSTLMPLLLGIIALAGLILRDPATVNRVTGELFSVMPSSAAGTLRTILTQSRNSAGAAGIISIVLLLFTGSSFFANMETVFDRAYHVPTRNFIMQRARGVVMLVVCTVLLAISTVAFSAGNFLSSASGSALSALPVGGQLSSGVAMVIGWSLAVVSAVVTFWLMYRFVPNKHQTWRQSLPGALAVTVLFFLTLELFPLYLTYFGKSFQTYATFGVFLLLMFWLYLLGIILVLGAELNAFLEAPARSTATAEAMAHASEGRVEFDRSGSRVTAESTGRGQGQDAGRTAASPSAAQADGSHAGTPAPQGAPRQTPASAESSRPTMAGRVMGLVGLVAAAVLLRGQAGRQRTATQHR